MNKNHAHWMQEAIKEAKKALHENEVPVGAVVIHDSKIIGKGYNQIEKLQDPTAHAEMIAITAATNYLQQKWLRDCALYVTIEPCSMCAGAMVLARIKTLVYGVQDVKTGAHSSVINLLNEPRLNHKIEVIPGILKDQCSTLMIDFFERLRENNKQ
jgi:tRNA(adenine34) deaminase